MKLSLVVAQGVHTGKVIPVTSADFVIGRDPVCQLRPASPAVSKQHCGIAVRDGKVFVRDCGSTNGTFVNGEQVAAEREVKTGDHLKVGPLEFTMKIDANAPITKSSPVMARPNLVKQPVAVGASGPPDSPGRSSTVVMDPPAPRLDERRANTTVVESPAALSDSISDMDGDAAALLLGMDDGPIGTAPTVEQASADATTVMEMPALGSKSGEIKKDTAKHGDSSSAAAELLSKYMRRPRT